MPVSISDGYTNGRNLEICPSVGRTLRAKRPQKQSVICGARCVAIVCGLSFALTACSFILLSLSRLVDQTVDSNVHPMANNRRHYVWQIFQAIKCYTVRLSRTMQGVAVILVGNRCLRSLLPICIW